MGDCPGCGNNCEVCGKTVEQQVVDLQSFTTESLTDLFEPLANAAVESQDSTTVKVGVVLATLAGCLAGGKVDVESLDALARTAGLICEHQLGQHATEPRLGNDDLAKLLADTFSRSRAADGGVGLPWEQRSESAKKSWREVAATARANA
jgi:hypothetical protein